MLLLRSVSKAYTPDVRGADPIPALRDVDLHVEAGEFVTVLGPSGCGKTTLLRTIAGFETPDAGTIMLHGRQVYGPGTRTVPAHGRGVGLVPQEGALFPHLNVGQNVGFGLGKLHRRQRLQRIEETLELVGLPGFAKRHPHELSGGQQQRVALARALAPEPAIILFDEPFSALDEYLRESVRNEVRELLTKLGATAILVTHDQEEALALGDRVVVMREGRIIQAAAPREAYFQPADLDLARFLGEAVVVRGDAREPATGATATVQCAFGELPVASWHGSSGGCDVLIRPENIAVCPLPFGAPDADGAVVGTVESKTFYGHDGVIKVNVPGIAEEISVRVLGDRQFEAGDQVALTVDCPVCTYPTS